MTINRPILASIFLALAACSANMQSMQLEDALSGYGAALRWGLWEKASDFQPPALRTPLDFKYLKTIRVTSYDPIYRKAEDGSNIIKQTVEIHYLEEQSGVEQVITDKQLWRYDEEKGAWFLESKMPTFRR